MKCDILKSGHHGSRTASGALFMNAVKPKEILISCGINNDYGHLHKEAMRTYERLGCKVYRTDTDGTITVNSDGEMHHVTTERGDNK